MELKNYAKSLQENGIKWFPTNGKVPFEGFMWKTKTATLDDFELFEKEKNQIAKTIAIQMGNGSDLLCIDFDTYKFGEKGKEILEQFYKDELIEFLNQEKRIYLEMTPQGGCHFIVKTKENYGNKKVAKVKTSNDKYECIIETKGEGGYIVTYPSPNYVKVSNFELWELVEIDKEEFEGIFDLLKSFNQESVEASIPLVSNTIYEGKKVWEYYNEEQSSVDYAKHLLEQAGWKLNGKNCTRPGKDSGVSATFGYVAQNVFYVFSTSCHPFEENKAYKPFNILTLLEFNGDYKESTKFLAKIYKNETPSMIDQPLAVQKDILSDCFVDYRKDVVMPTPIVSFINDYSTALQKNIGVLSLGDISVLTGQQKAKKTFFLNKIIESYLNNGRVIDDRIVSNVLPNKTKVCVIDTEQSDYWANKNAKRINRISRSDNFDYIALRKFSPTDRKQRIELYLNNYSKDLGFLIIDGIVDLCNNSNDMEESMSIVNWLMNISASKNIHILCVLHLNPGLSSNGETKMRGFLGTIIAQKAESVIQIEKDKNNEAQSKISAKDVRGESFKPFSIEIDSTGTPRLLSLGEVYNDNEYSKKFSSDSPF
jgi:hypothetical protein